MSDFSEYLTPERLCLEEAGWIRDHLFERYAQKIYEMMYDLGICKVVELGCGTGWVPLHLPPHIHYRGVDANPLCIEMARIKNDRLRRPNHDALFQVGDLREWNEHCEMICTFAVLKHFGVDEWRDLFAHLLSLTDHLLFSLPLSSFPGTPLHDESAKLNTTYPHVCIGEESLKGLIRNNGHEVLWIDYGGPYIGEPLIATGRK